MTSPLRSQSLRPAAPPFYLAPAQQRAHPLGPAQYTRFCEVAAACHTFVQTVLSYLPTAEIHLIGSAVGYVTDSLAMNDIDLHILVDGATLDQCADIFCTAQGNVLDVRRILRCQETGNSVLFIGARGIDACFELTQQRVATLLYLTETGVLGLPLHTKDPAIICRYPSPHRLETLLAKLAAGEFCVVEPETRFRLLFRLSLAHCKGQTILEKARCENAARTEVASYTTQSFVSALSAHKRHFENTPDRFLPSILYCITVLQESSALPHFAMALLPYLPETAKALLAGKAHAICQTQKGAPSYLAAIAELPEPALRAELGLVGEVDFVRKNPNYFCQLESQPGFIHSRDTATLGKQLLPSADWQRRQLLAELSKAHPTSKQELLSLIRRIFIAEEEGLLLARHRSRYIKNLALSAERLFAADAHREPYASPSQELISFFANHEPLPKGLATLLRLAPLVHFRQTLPPDFSQKTQAYYTSLACGQNLASHALTAIELLASLYPEAPSLVLACSKYWLSKNPDTDKAAFYPLYLTLLESEDGHSLALYALPYIKTLPVTDLESTLLQPELLNQRLNIQPESPTPPSSTRPALECSTDYSTVPAAPQTTTPSIRRKKPPKVDSDSAYLAQVLREENFKRPWEQRHRLSFMQKIFAISLIFRIAYEFLPTYNYPRSLEKACQEPSKLHCATELNTYLLGCYKPLICYASTQALAEKIMQAASKEEALWPALDTYASHLTTQVLASPTLNYKPVIYHPVPDSTDSRIQRLFFAINRPAVAHALRYLHKAMSELLPGHYFNEPEEAKRLLSQLQNLSGSCDRLMPYENGPELQAFFEEKLVPRFTASIMLSALPHPNKLKVLDSLVHWLAQRSIYALTAAAAAKANPNSPFLAEGIWSVLAPYQTRMQHHNAYNLLPKIREFLETHWTQSNTLQEKLQILYSDSRRNYEAKQKASGSFLPTIDRIGEFAKIIGAKQQLTAISRLHEWEDLVAELNAP